MKIRHERDAQLKRQLMTMLADGTFQQILGHRSPTKACQFEFHVHRAFHVTVHDHKISVDEYEANQIRRRVRGRWRQLQAPRLHQGRTEVHLPLGAGAGMLGRLKQAIAAVGTAVLLAMTAVAFAEAREIMLRTVDDGDGGEPTRRGGGSGSGGGPSPDVTPPTRPTVNAVTSPTRTTPSPLAGTKEANSSILINGAVKVSVNSSTSWSCSQSLAEGSNPLSITSKDAAGNTSQALNIAITLDTTPPSFTITSPADGAVLGPP